MGKLSEEDVYKRQVFVLVESFFFYQRCQMFYQTANLFILDETIIK